MKSEMEDTERYIYTKRVEVAQYATHMQTRVEAIKAQTRIRHHASTFST